MPTNFIWLIVEIVSIVSSLIFLLLLMNQKISCWFWGILSSVLSIALFFNVNLYAESILYCIYAILGVYGWIYWKMNTQPNTQSVPIRNWTSLTYTLITGLGFLLSIIGGFILSTYTNASKPYIDVATTIFGIIATVLEAKKIVFAWLMWIGINAVSSYLYFIKGLDFYAALMVIYTILSVVGWKKWRKELTREQSKDFPFK